MSKKKLFTSDFLELHYKDFNLSFIPNINSITRVIQDFIREIESGKIASLKEEEIKSRFISLFFGEILGYNDTNSKEWLLREEKKTYVDGTKPDAVLGYFYNNKAEDLVRAVIEIKDANTNLNSKKSKTKNYENATEQAFSYAPKMGGHCKWVIVSNIKEIIFYSSNDSTRCQQYQFVDLANEKTLKELVFLFHKDRFIRPFGESKTDKLLLLSKENLIREKSPKHIIDQLYFSLKKFDSLSFIDPNYIANIRPFNILDDFVWQYNEGNLFTINPEIYTLLVEIEIIDNQIIISEKLNTEINNENIVDAENKIRWVFQKLNKCQIVSISAIKNYQKIANEQRQTIGFSINHSFSFRENEEGITRNISFFENITCDCLSCNFRNFDLLKLAKKVKSADWIKNIKPFELAYGNYLLADNNFKSSFLILQTIEKQSKGREGSSIEYFLSKYNIKFLHNLILLYDNEDKNQIMQYIKSIDLEKAINEEIDYFIDKEVGRYLKKILDDDLLTKAEQIIDETLIELEELKTLYENGGKQQFGPQYHKIIIYQYHLAYLHVNTNFLIYDIFKHYKRFTKKVFRGLLISGELPEFGISEIPEFFLVEAIIHIPSGDLNKVLNTFQKLHTSEDCTKNILYRLINLLKSIYLDGFFNEPHKNSLVTSQLDYHIFSSRVENIFTNIFIILIKLEIKSADFKPCIKPLISFLKVEDFLNWDNLEPLSNFIISKGFLFEPSDLFAILELAIKRYKLHYIKYKETLINTTLAINKYYPDFSMNNQILVKTALNNSWNDKGTMVDYSSITGLYHICDENCQKILFDEFSNDLKLRFRKDFYQKILREKIINYDQSNYFLKYIESTNSERGPHNYRFGNQKLTDVVFYKFVLTVYLLEIDFGINELKNLVILNDFEKWFINPVEFDYDSFEPNWLLDFNYEVFLSRFKKIAKIGIILENHLKMEFNPILAEIKYKYFSQNLR